MPGKNGECCKHLLLFRLTAFKAERDKLGNVPYSYKRLLRV